MIYFYHDGNLPVFLFAVFGKGEKSNINDAEKRLLKKITAETVRAYGAKK